MAALTKAAHANDTQAIKDATLKVQQDYARILKGAIPQSLRDRFGDAVNDLLQPRTPMIKKRK